MTWWRSRAATVVVVIGTVVGFAVVAPRLQITTTIADFFPDRQQRSAQLAAVLAHSDLARIMVIDLRMDPPVGTPESPRALAGKLYEFLRFHPDVARVTSGVTENDARAVLEFLHQWPATTFVPAAAYNHAEIPARLLELRESLAGPFGVVARQAAPRDPLGGVWRTLRELRESQAASIVDDEGIMVTPDRRHAFIFVETKASPFDSDAQRRFRLVLDRWMNREAPASARLQTAGAAQFAIASEAQMKRDVSRIGIVSTVGIVVVFLLLFGSVRLIAIGFVPMLFGSAIATMACHAWFGEIHGITIAFGTSLLGVGLDYTEHYFAHFALTPTAVPATTMRRVAPSIALGALTTVIGFAGIAASGLPGLRQMAMFSAIAIVASLAATYWMLPPWMPSAYRPPRVLGAVHRSIGAVMKRLTRARWNSAVRAVLVGGIAVAIVAGLRTGQFSDRVNMLVDETGAHVADDRAVRSRLGPEASAFAVVTAFTDDALMVAIGRATSELAIARGRGAVTSFLPLGVVTPSAAEQWARLAAARSQVAAIRAAMVDLEFVPEAFRPFWDGLAATPLRDLSLDDIRRSPLAPIVAAWLPSPTSAGPVALIPLFGVRDLPALRTQVPSATIIVPADAMVDVFRSVRTSTIVASLGGMVAIATLLLLRYRRLRHVAVALAPALLACAATTATLAILGTTLTILHVMALLLVVSLAVDFGIFLVDAAGTPEDSARTLVSIVTASITTLLSFGLLSASRSPGLAALGTTVTLGVTYSLGMCFVLARKRAEP